MHSVSQNTDYQFSFTADPAGSFLGFVCEFAGLSESDSARSEPNAGVPVGDNSAI